MTFVLDLNDTPHLWYRSRVVGKFENTGGGAQIIIYCAYPGPLVGMRLTDLPKSGKATLIEMF